MAALPSKKVTPPRFHPDIANADAAAWCKTVDLIIAESVLENSALWFSNLLLWNEVAGIPRLVS